jgi:hypothetical protein
MGSIYGVTITSAIVQNVLMTRLPGALGAEGTDEVILSQYPRSTGY